MSGAACAGEQAATRRVSQPWRWIAYRLSREEAALAPSTKSQGSENLPDPNIALNGAELVASDPMLTANPFLSLLTQSRAWSRSTSSRRRLIASLTRRP